MQMLSKAQPIGEAKRLSRISMKPTVKTTIGIPRSQKKSGLINANCQKEAVNKLEMIKRKNISSGRKALADISNSRGVFQKNDTFDGSRPGFPCANSNKLKDLKVFNDVKRNFPRNTKPTQRPPFLVPKHVDKKNLEHKVKNKEVYSFPVKPKAGTKVIPQVSNAQDNRWRNKACDGSMQMLSKAQPIRDAKRLSRIPMKPTVKTTIGIPKAQKASNITAKGKSVLSKKAATSRSSANKHTESGRRRSYTSSLTENTKLPEIYDGCNQLDVAEYVDEIYKHYWVTEEHNQSLKDYMKIQTDITPQMRGILINWLIEVHLMFDLTQETLYLMVTLLDYYLSAATCKISELQFVGLTSLLLASKYEDFWPPKVMELIGILEYTRDQILEMEKRIINKLNFCLNWPTPYVFMLRFLRAAQADKKFEKLAFYLIELCFGGI